jgi:facilitated trehalose transporter
VWKPFFILVAFFLFQEGSGIYIILFYAVDFVREVGTGAAYESVVSIGVGLARLIMSVVGAFLLCKFPRKSLAVTSALLMTLAMAAMATYEFLFSSFEPEDRVIFSIS